VVAEAKVFFKIKIKKEQGPVAYDEELANCSSETGGQFFKGELPRQKL
jgi:hypothetical protein